MKKVVIILLLVLLVGCGQEKEKQDIKIPSISASEVHRMISNEENITIIDVRSKAEYDSGHIESAINIPLEEISNTSLGKNEKIIVYCQSGYRSSMAAEQLLKNGYTDVSDLGGIHTWTYGIVVE